MVSHLLTIPREIRDQIYGYLLPDDRVMAHMDFYDEVHADMRCYISLRAVNKKFQAEIMDHFNTSVPLHFTHAWLPDGVGWSLWGCPFSLGENVIVEMTTWDDRQLRWDISKARNLIISIDIWEWGTNTDAIRPLSVVERIAKLSVKFEIHIEDICESFETSLSPEERLTAIDAIASAVREYGEMIRLNLAREGKGGKHDVESGGSLEDERGRAQDIQGEIRGLSQRVAAKDCLFL